MNPEDAYLVVRDLGDGRKAGVMPLTFGRARVVTWAVGDWMFIEDGW